MHDRNDSRRMRIEFAGNTPRAAVSRTVDLTNLKKTARTLECAPFVPKCHARRQTGHVTSEYVAKAHGNAGLVVASRKVCLRRAGAMDEVDRAIHFCPFGQRVFGKQHARVADAAAKRGPVRV